MCLICWLKKQIKKQKEQKKEIKEWPNEFSKEEMSAGDITILMFAMEESRLYLDKISENTNRLSNKGFILLGIAGGMVTFIVNTIIWFIGFAQTTNATQSFNQILQKQWLLVILMMFCSFCLLRACCILFKIIFPTSYLPLGSIPKNLLKEKVLKRKINEVLVSQMINYQERIDKNMEQNYLISDYIEKSIRWIIIYPVAAIFIWVIIYFIRYLCWCPYAL